MNITTKEDVEPELLELKDHWGEFPQKATEPAEFDYSVVMAVMCMEPEPPMKKLPVADVHHDVKPVFLPQDESMTTEILKHNIRLNRFAKEVGCLLKNIEENPTPANIKECPPFPVLSKKKMERFGQPESTEDKQRLQMQSKLPADVSDEVMQKMLEKSVITILANVGFDKVEKSALLVFVDIVKSMLSKLALMVHELMQRDITEGKIAYKDVLEKAFRSVGFSGLDCVREYFKKTLLTKRRLTIHKAKHLQIQYNQKVAEIMKRNSLSAGSGTSAQAESAQQGLTSTAAGSETLPMDIDCSLNMVIN
ncbi:Hypothetical protein NTJ_10621 [Nesidiocoris tenuis]|uniref:Bromodomain associated domain-containing protein n=1 Tax=Nesidiocoris tenuis TaxID=355587 RepID=A0ABN7B4X8_9HEMI|nr:Hypothetical protein NTJ_10621 [Nesidiocoris tenuis]